MPRTTKKAPLKKTKILKIVIPERSESFDKNCHPERSEGPAFLPRHHRPPPISTREAMSAGLL
jgi:hypothetical protein